MDTNTIVKNCYESEIKRIFKDKTDLMNHFLKHPRRERLIENVCKEVRIAELRYGTKMNRERVEALGKMMVPAFCKISLNYVEEKAKTNLQKQVERQKHDEQEELEKFFEENVKIVDKSL